MKKNNHPETTDGYSKNSLFLSSVLYLLFIFLCCSFSGFADFASVDGTVSSDSCYTILTANVPRYACWLVCMAL